MEEIVTAHPQMAEPSTRRDELLEHISIRDEWSGELTD
jgi:hypothetical protein